MVKILVSARGTVGATTTTPDPEIWSFGLWFATLDGTLSTPEGFSWDAVAAACYQDVRDWLRDPVMDISDTVDLKEVRTYTYLQNDSPALDIGYYTDPDGHAGLASGSRLPLQTTLAITLAAEGRTKPRFGRFYMPLQALALGPDGRISTTDAAAYVARSKALLSGLDTTLGTLLGEDFFAAVNSTIPGRNVRPVVEMRCGRVPDTIRRRRNGLDEDYQVIPYP